MLNIPLTELAHFLTHIRYNYNKRSNPFHNFDHGLNVMHSCYMISHLTRAQLYLKDLRKFSLIFAGLCHDVAHTAKTNIFEVNSLSKLAVRYHDRSVLEQHHIAQTFKILRQDETNIFKNASTEQFLTIRKYVINDILATDIKEHFNKLKIFELNSKDWISPEKLGNFTINLFGFFDLINKFIKIFYNN